MAIEKLLEPGAIGTLKLKNRIIYSSMDLRSTDGQGHMSPEAVDSVVYHAEHGPGLVHFPGVYAWSIPDAPFGLTLSLGDDSFIPPLKEAVGVYMLPAPRRCSSFTPAAPALPAAPKRLGRLQCSSVLKRSQPAP